MAGGEWLRNNLNAIAAFMGTWTWDSIEKIALTLSVLAVAVMWVQRHNVMDLLGWVAVFVLISLLVNVRTSVQIIDNSDLVKVHRVDNVPVGLAMPLSLTTRIGHAMVASYEMIFTQPDSVTYSKTGMLFGANLIVKSTDFLSRNPEIINLFQDYVQNCVLGDIYLNHKYTLEDLMASADPYTLIFSRPSPLRGVYDNNNNFITCKDASVTLKDRLNLDTKTGGKTWHYYVQQIFGGRPDPDLLFRQLVSDSYSYFYGSSQSASQIMRQNVTMNALKEGIRDSEIQNFCLHGTVGAGKSEVIRRLANYARQRGDMVVIYDRSGEFVKSYYDPSIDKILNPLDARCAAWDLWKECLTQPDFDNTANTLIPMGTKEDPFWQGSGRTIFAEAAYLMRNDPNRSYSKLVDTLLSIKIEKLRTYLRNSPAANLVEEKIEKTAISIRAVLTNYVKAIRYLQGIEHNGEPFTIRDWMRGVREDQKNGWLFISSNADTHASLKPVISMWLSIAIRGLLAMGENRNRRVWFFCDELPTLHKLPDLVEILPEARKFGGCYVFGIQSYAQLEDIYGEKAAASLFDVMNTRAFFRSPSHKIAEFAAGEIGEKEHLKASEQYSYGADPVRDGVSTGKDMERQTLVSYSDIQSLPDLTCYVTLPGPYPAVKLSLKYQTRPKVAPEFIPRDINPEMENRLSAVLAAREAEGRQMASLFEPDVPEVVSGEDVTQAEQPQQPVSPAINDKKSDSGVNVPAGGIEQELKMKPEEEMEQQLPPGISESGEVVDMAAYEAWQQENHPDIQQQMQRREEVNINVHRERGEDVEPGDDF
ncbi:type IV conjugative transfer system coupling protein TraD [Escherichia coli]